MFKRNTKKAMQEALDAIRTLCEHSTDDGHENAYVILGRIESISEAPYLENVRIPGE